MLHDFNRVICYNECNDNQNTAPPVALLPAGGNSMIKTSLDSEDFVLYDGLRSNHWLPDGTRIEIEKTNGKPTCWYRLTCGPGGWGVLEVLNTKQVKERLRI